MAEGTSDPHKTIQVDGVELACASCRCILREPILLPCLHSVCKDCLCNMFGSDQVRDAITCPECAETINRPDAGIDGFQTNYYLKNMLSIFNRKSKFDIQCKVCQLKNVNVSATYICIKCNEFLCTDCSNAHSSTSITIKHEVVLLSDLTSGSRDREIRDNQKIDCKSHPDEAMNYYCETCNIPICRECQLEHHVRHKCKRASDSQSSKRKTIQHMTEDITKKAKAFKKLEAGVSKTLDDIDQRQNSLIEGVEKTAKKLIDQVEKEKRQVLEELKRTTDIQRQACNERKDQISKLHTIMTGNIKVCMDIVNNGNADELLFLEKIIKQRLHSHQSTDIQHEVKWCPPDIRFRNMFLTKGKIGLYELVHESPDFVRQLDVPFKFGARHVAGLQLVSRLPTTTLEDDTECRVTGLACGKNGTFIVGDHKNRKIKLFAMKGTFLETIANIKPTCLALCGHDTIACTDQMSLTLYVNTDVVKKVSLESTRSSYPLASFLDEYLLIADTKTSRFQLYDNTGDLCREIVPDTVSNMNNVAFIATSSHGNIILSDWATHSLMIIDKCGKLIKSFKLNPAIKKNGWLPGSLCVDQFDYIFVADFSKRRIIVLTPDGEFMFEYLDSEWYIDKPRCMASDGKGTLLVTGQSGYINVYTCRYI